MQVKTPKLPYALDIPRWIYNHWILYYTSTLIPILYFCLLLISNYFLSARTIILSILPFFIFLIVPIIDHVTKDYFITYIDPKSINKPSKADLDDNWFYFYKSSLWIFTLAQCVVFLYTQYYVMDVDPFGIDFWLLCFNNGVLMTFASGVAHELYHKRAWMDRFCGLTLLTLNSYNHFYIQHIDGHHKWVATESDPNTAKYNETIYSFIPRSVFGGYINSWILEGERLNRKDLSSFHPSNRMIWSSLFTIGLPFIIYKWIGYNSLLLFFSQAIVAMIFTETINYIEHYGLVRNIKDGVVEPVGYQHSWDAPYRLSCYLGSNILLHADHHMHATKEYEKLSAIEGAPIMPHTYITMVLLSFIPPIFFACVNPILENFQKRQ
jgi:alkane 1-monooxygenase